MKVAMSLGFFSYVGLNFLFDVRSTVLYLNYRVGIVVHNCFDFDGWLTLGFLYRLLL
jgi:hypothetical protein